MSKSFSEFKPITAETHFLLLPLFYSFPKELVAGSEFFDLPRSLYEVISDSDTLERIKSKQFLKDMTDMTAYMVWFHMGHRGWMEVYSGYSPAFVFSHLLRYWRDLFYTVYRDMNLFDLIQNQVQFEWNTLEQAKTVWKRVVDFSDTHFSIIRDTIAIEKELPCFEDFDLESRTAWRSRSYYDFLRKWYHTQTQHPIMLSNRIPNRAVFWTDSVDYRIDLETFIESLEPAEREIFNLRWAGKTQTEIAEIMGYKTHSAVQKRLVKIRKAYDLWFHPAEELEQAEDK